MTTHTIRHSAGDTIPDIRDIFLMLRRQRGRMIVVAFGTLLACGAFFTLRPAAYEAAAIVMIEDRALNLKDFKDVTEGARFDNLTLQTQVRMLQSPALVRTTIEAAGLMTSPGFSGLAVAEAAGRFLDALRVTPQGSSRVIEISYRADDPEFAARAANAHVQSYIQAQIESKRRRVAELSGWFEERVADLKADVIAKSQAVEQYRARENLIMGRDSGDIVTQQISDIAAQLVPVQVHKYDVQGKLEALESARRAGQGEAVAETVDSRLVQELKAQASLAAQKLESMRAQYGENHPRLQASGRELTEIQQAISAETARIESSLRNEQKAAASQEAMLMAKLEALNKDADTLRSKMITMKALQVEQEASQKLLDSFLANFESIQAQDNFARPDAVIISEAVAPAMPAGPGRALSALIAVMVAAGAALAAACAGELGRSGLRNFDDLGRMGQVPLGILPRRADPVSILQAGNSSLKECVKRIYMSGLITSPARALLITSALPGEGRTTFARALGYYLLSIGQSVIVLDADMLRPDLGGSTRSPAGAGMAEVLARRVALEQAIDKDRNGLPVLRRGAAELLTPDMLASPRFHKLLSDLRERYAYVLIDSGPVLARAEAGVIARQAEGVIAVARWDFTSRKDIASMFALLAASGTPVLGTVINRVDIARYKSGTDGADFLLPRRAA